MPARGGYTDGPTVLPAGALEVEGGYTKDQDGTAGYTSIGESLLRVGLGKSTELSIFANSFAIATETGQPNVTGREDPKLGIKTTLLEQEDTVHTFMPSIAVLGGLTLPFGSPDFNAVHAQPEAKIAFSWSTPTPLSIYSNLGIGAVFDGTDWGAREWVSTALWYTVTEKVSVFVEGISTRSIGGSALPSNAFDTGITYLFNDRFQVDYRIGHGFGPPSGAERFFGVGFALRF